MPPYALYKNKVVFRNMRKAISIIILVAFIATSIKSPAYAQAAAVDQMPFMPQPGVMVHLSTQYNPAYLKGIVIHPENPLKLDFIIYKGDEALSDTQKSKEYTRLVKYFLASLAIPDDDQWVNLSPYEKNRIIKEDFGKTEMGRDLLAQDYILKQITASLIYPQDNLGQKFWDRIYAQAYKQFGTTNIPVNTFNKVWIVPDSAEICETGNMAYVLKNHLKVMLEEDYLSLQRHGGIETNNTIAQNKAHAVASRVVREVILPALEKEINEGKNFAVLRQVFSGVVLAAWYKRAMKESFLGKVYMNRSKLKGVDQDPQNNEIIYQRYLRAFKKGVFNYIKEDVNKYTNETVPRKYFSGGALVRYTDKTLDIENPAQMSVEQRYTVGREASDEDRGEFLFGEQKEAQAERNALAAGEAAPAMIVAGMEVRYNNPPGITTRTSIFKSKSWMPKGVVSNYVHQFSVNVIENQKLGNYVSLGAFERVYQLLKSRTLFSLKQKSPTEARALAAKLLSKEGKAKVQAAYYVAQQQGLKGTAFQNAVINQVVPFLAGVETPKVDLKTTKIELLRRKPILGLKASYSRDKFWENPFSGVGGVRGVSVDVEGNPAEGFYLEIGWMINKGALIVGQPSIYVDLGHNQEFAKAVFKGMSKIDTRNVVKERARGESPNRNKLFNEGLRPLLEVIKTDFDKRAAPAEAAPAMIVETGKNIRKVDQSNFPGWEGFQVIDQGILDSIATPGMNLSLYLKSGELIIVGMRLTVKVQIPHQFMDDRSGPASDPDIKGIKSVKVVKGDLVIATTGKVITIAGNGKVSVGASEAMIVAGMEVNYQNPSISDVKTSTPETTSWKSNGKESSYVERFSVAVTENQELGSYVTLSAEERKSGMLVSRVLFSLKQNSAAEARALAEKLSSEEGKVNVGAAYYIAKAQGLSSYAFQDAVIKQVVPFLAGVETAKPDLKATNFTFIDGQPILAFKETYKKDQHWQIPYSGDGGVRNIILGVEGNPDEGFYLRLNWEINEGAMLVGQPSIYIGLGHNQKFAEAVFHGMSEDKTRDMVRERARGGSVNRHALFNNELPPLLEPIKTKFDQTAAEASPAMIVETGKNIRKVDQSNFPGWEGFQVIDQGILGSIATPGMNLSLYLKSGELIIVGMRLTVKVQIPHQFMDDRSGPASDPDIKGVKSVKVVKGDLVIATTDKVITIAGNGRVSVGASEAMMVKRIVAATKSFARVKLAAFALPRAKSTFGGIDFNAANLNLKIKRDGNGVPLPLSQQDMAQISNLEGLEPVLLGIQPAAGSSLLSALTKTP